MEPQSSDERSLLTLGMLHAHPIKEKITIFCVFFNKLQLIYIIWILSFYYALVSPERSVKSQRLASLRKPVATLELKYAEGNYGLCTSDE